MSNLEYIDVLIKAAKDYYVIQKTAFIRGSLEAKEARDMMSVLGYNAKNEGIAIYRDVDTEYRLVNDLNNEYPIEIEEDIKKR